MICHANAACNSLELLIMHSLLGILSGESLLVYTQVLAPPGSIVLSERS